MDRPEPGQAREPGKWRDPETRAEIAPVEAQEQRAEERSGHQEGTRGWLPLRADEEPGEPRTRDPWKHWIGAASGMPVSGGAKLAAR